MTTGHEWGGGQDLTAWEAVMWRLEADPRTRATSIIVEMLDTEPDWERFLSAHERGSRKVPRLRDRVVEPAPPMGLPAWSVDTHFDIEHHVYRVRLPEPGTRAQLQEALEAIMHRPLDRARPPWEVVLITGLEGGGAAYALKTHHALSDGMGLVHLMEVGQSRTRQPGPRQVPPTHESPRYTPQRLAARRMRELLLGTPLEMVKMSAGTGLFLGKRSLRPARSVTEAVSWINAARRGLSSPPALRSPLLLGSGGFGCRILLYDVSLSGLRAAGKAAGGTVNDAYLAGMLGAMRAYHEHHHVSDVGLLPITMPISNRRVIDTSGGNHFTAARFAVPLAECDPAARLREIRALVLAARRDPTLGLIEQIARAALYLPDPLLADAVAARTSGTDMQISNIPGVRHETYIAGAKVTRTYPVGPRPAVAVMAAMMSYEGTACIALNVDADVFTDMDVLRDCLDVGFGEVLALGGESTEAATL